MTCIFKNFVVNFKNFLPKILPKITVLLSITYN